MKLELFHEFTIDVIKEDSTTTLSANMRDLTSKEKKELEKLNKAIKHAQEQIAKHERLTRSIEIKREMAALVEAEDKLAALKEIETLVAKADELQDDIMAKYDTIDMEAPIKYRLNTTIGGKDAKEVIKMAEDIGYSRAFTVIGKAIAEAQEKK